MIMLMMMMMMVMELNWPISSFNCKVDEIMSYYYKNNGLNARITSLLGPKSWYWFAAPGFLAPCESEETATTMTHSLRPMPIGLLIINSPQVDERRSEGPDCVTIKAETAMGLFELRI